MSLLETGLPAAHPRATSPDLGSALPSYPVRPDLLPTEQSIAGRYLSDSPARRRTWKPSSVCASRSSTSSCARDSTRPSIPDGTTTTSIPGFTT